MTLTLDYIIAFLTDKITEPITIEKKFSLTYGESLNLFPDEFSKLLGPNVDRYGIKNQHDIKEMIFESVLFCSDIAYRNLVQEDQELYKMALLKELITNIKTVHNLTNTGIKNVPQRSGIAPSLSEIHDGIIKNNMEMILMSISCYLEINIFVFDFDDNKIYVYYPEKLFNKYKNNIFLARSNKLFEPIVQKNAFFNYNNKILNDVICSQNIVTNKEYIIGASVEEILFSLNQKVFEVKDNLIDNKSDSELNYNKKVSKVPDLIDEDDDDDDYREITVSKTIIDINEDDDVSQRSEITLHSADIPIIDKKEIEEIESVKEEKINTNNNLPASVLYLNKSYLKRQRKNELINILTNDLIESKKLEKNTRDVLINMILEKYSK